MSAGGVASVIASVESRIEPDAEERAALAAVLEELTERTETALEAHDVEADVVQVGSTARDTWVSGDRDIDLFVRFDPDVDRETLRRVGLAVGNEVLPDGREEYAEHPYVHGEFDGFAVDLVPCYRVGAATDIKSAVDRTPFHNAYLEAHIDADLAGEVRLLKQFLKGIGVYGSDLRTEGYSGYLTELLVLEYGGFEAVLQAASEWQPQIYLDPEAQGTESFEDPLVVIDPTDPGRNVAAVVAAENVARLTHHARQFLADPAEAYFFPEPAPAMDEEAVRSVIEKRGTTPLAVRLAAPDLVDDQLYPQLQRSREGLVRGLETRDFEVLRSDAWAADHAVLFVELSDGQLPAVERHEGPPVHVAPHATRFFETYADADVYGPFIDGDRYVVERERAYPRAAEFVREELGSVALGAHIETVVEEDGYEVLEGEAVATLASEFGRELAAYFRPEA